MLSKMGVGPSEFENNVHALFLHLEQHVPCFLGQLTRQERGDGIIIRNEEKRRDDGDDELNEERRHGTGHIRYRAQSACGDGGDH